MKALLLSAIQLFYLSAFANDRTLDKTQFCDKYKGNIISYLGDVYFLKKEGKSCKRYPIKDSYLMDSLGDGVSSPIPVDKFRVSQFPVGKDLSRLEFLQSVKTKKKSISQVCRELPVNIVTTDQVTYYLVKNCVAHKLIIPNKENQGFMPDEKSATLISPENLARFKKGKAMKVRSKIKGSDIIYYANGSPLWSRVMDASNKGNELKPNVLESQIDKIKNPKPLKRSEVCKRLNGKIVVFYGSVSFISNCTRHEVEDLSEEIQAVLEKQGDKVTEMTSREWDILREGQPYTSNKVMQYLK